MWIAFATTCAFGNALWTALTKPIVQDLPPLRMMAIFRVLVALLLVVPFVIFGHLPASATFWLIVAAIGALHSARWLIIMHGVKHDYFSTYAMYNTAPLFTLILAPTMLPERFGPTVWLGVLAIIAGGAMFYRTSHISLYGLVGAVMTAFVNILSKQGLNEMHPAAFILLMQGSSAVVLGIAFLVAGDRWSGPGRVRRGEALRIAPLAVLSALAGMAFMYALSLDTATRVTAVVRTNLIFGFIFSYLMLREKSDWQWKLGGALLILTGTVAVAL
jgi:drug/metabolite transporter (DMT)-like permease